MNNTRSRPTLSWRSFLTLLAAAGLTAAASDLLLEYAPWLDYDQQADQTRSAFPKETAMSAHTRELVRYATLAANAHNSQPWKFVIKDKLIEIHPDYTRRLPVVAPQNREMWYRFGCAL